MSENSRLSCRTREGIYANQETTVNNRLILGIPFRGIRSPRVRQRRGREGRRHERDRSIAGHQWSRDGRLGLGRLGVSSYKLWFDKNVAVFTEIASISRRETPLRRNDLAEELSELVPPLWAAFVHTPLFSFILFVQHIAAT